MAKTGQICVAQPVALLKYVTRFQGVVIAGVNRDGQETFVIR